MHKTEWFIEHESDSDQRQRELVLLLMPYKNTVIIIIIVIIININTFVMDGWCLLQLLVMRSFSLLIFTAKLATVMRLLHSSLMLQTATRKLT